MSPVKPYNDTDPKKEQVRTMFDRIAFRYDFLNRLLSFGVDREWRRRTIRAVAADAPVAVLDLATGTGDLALGLARALPRATVTGADLSPEMLAIGRQKVAKKGIPNIAAMIEADAEALPFAAGTFDAVTVGFGVRNFGDLPAGLAEMHRVLRRGGRVYILEFGMPKGAVFGRLFTFYFRRLLPAVGGIFSRQQKAYRYLQRSVEEFPYGERFIDMLRAAGFTNVACTPLTGGLAGIYRGEKRP